MKEKAYENKLRRWLHEQGIYTFKNWSGASSTGQNFTISGRPDLSCVHLGTNKYFEIEVKTDTGQLRPKQIEWMRDTTHSWLIIVSRPKTFEEDKKTIKEYLSTPCLV